MAVVIINLPGLLPSAAQDLVNMALHEWRMAREGDYVDLRYAGMKPDFRERRKARLAREMKALSESFINSKVSL